MIDFQHLIKLLADGEFHSGEAIGRHLGISRAAVWKQLQKLENFGLQVESIKGRGYRLLQVIELLDVGLIQNTLPLSAATQLSELEVFFQIDSTNAHAMKKIQMNQTNKGYVCLAEFQEQGRGRRGRQWHSPLGSNLSLSLVWEFEGGAAKLEGLSLAIGIAVVRALKRIELQGLGLKWPNDILLNGSKLGGILLEMSGDPSGLCQVVIGVGLNINMDGEQGEINQSWTSLKQQGHRVSRNVLVTAIIAELIELLNDYEQQGFAGLVDEWRQYDAYSGRQVELSSGSHCYQGEVLGVADNGALILKVGGQAQHFHGGELSMKAVQSNSSER